VLACLDALVKTSHQEKKVNQWSEKLTKAEKPTQE
jgi:hypothetical protein